MALVTLYDRETGAPHRVHPVDVADILATGGYQQEPPGLPLLSAAEPDTMADPPVPVRAAAQRSHAKKEP